MSGLSTVLPYHFVRRLAVSLLVVALLAMTLRFVAAAELLSASVATVMALGCLALGLWLRGRHRSSAWRVAWALLAAALVVQTLLSVRSAWTGFSASYPATIDWVRVGCSLVALIALGRLLSSRARGRALDVVLEALLLTSTILFLPWVWAVARGVAPAHAAVVLAPVGAWGVSLWMLARLVFLTKEHIAGYLYLGASFVCLVAVNAAYAGSSLQGVNIDRHDLFGLALWAYCLWGVAALHPSMSQSFEPAAPRSSSFGFAQLTLCGAAVAVVPVSLILAGDGRGARENSVVLAGAALIPLVLVVYLVRQIRNRAKAEYRAQHDPLTGLPNRTLFNDRVDVALAHARRDDTGIAVMFLDLDRFKSINDSLGHAVGNQLLQAVAKRLCDTVREIDTVARMGGDEFTILLHGINSRDDAANVAGKITEQFAMPFNTGGRELHTSGSIGIALFPADGEDVESLLKHADSAMYRAKAHGRDTYEFFTRDMSVQAQARLSVESGLRNALDRHGLELHYQPQVDVNSGDIIGLEALARWPHKDVGTVMPNVFVPIAEETGLIVPLGEWAIDQALSDLQKWLNAGIQPRPVAVNVSARQLSDGVLADKVANALRRHDVPPELLVLEITESVFMRDLPRSTATLRELRDLGVGCSIDDFGTGFSGLSYLADMPIDSLKIDQSFVRHVRNAHDCAPIVEAIIGLANGLQLAVIAEGVETQEQARFLADHGCTQMQGYLFSAPRPLGEITNLLERDDRNEVEWLTPERDVTSSNATSDTSLLLAALCGGVAVDENQDHIAHLLSALIPPDTIVSTPSAFRTASMRIAAGSFAGLIPISTGLAAAHALPNPVQSVVATTLNAAGINLPGASPHHGPDREIAFPADEHGRADRTNEHGPNLNYTATIDTGLSNNTSGDNPPPNTDINNPGNGNPANGGNGNPGNSGGNGGNDNPGNANPGNGGGNGNPGNRGNGGNRNPGNGGGNGGNRNPGNGGGNGNPGNRGSGGNGNPRNRGNGGNGNPGNGGGKR